MDAPHVVGDRHRLLEPLPGSGDPAPWTATDEWSEQAVLLVPVDVPTDRDRAAAVRRVVGREVRAAGELRGRGVTPVLDVVVDGPTRVWVVHGWRAATRTLRTVLDTDGAPAPARVARWGRDLADGLAAVHALGLRHRDVRPERVAVHDDGSAALLAVAATVDHADDDELAAAANGANPGPGALAAEVRALAAMLRTVASSAEGATDSGLDGLLAAVAAERAPDAASLGRRLAAGLAASPTAAAPLGSGGSGGAGAAVPTSDGDEESTVRQSARAESALPTSSGPVPNAWPASAAPSSERGAAPAGPSGPATPANPAPYDSATLAPYDPAPYGPAPSGRSSSAPYSPYAAPAPYVPAPGGQGGPGGPGGPVWSQGPGPAMGPGAGPGAGPGGPPRRRRTGLVVGLAVGVVLLLAAGVAITVVATRDSPAPQAAPAAAATTSATTPTTSAAPPPAPVARPVLGDPRQADPCSLFTPTDLASFGTPQLQPSFGLLASCQVQVSERTGGSFYTTARFEAAGDFTPLPTTERVGDVGVYRYDKAGATCGRELFLSDGTAVYLFAAPFDGPRVRADMCAVVDATTTTAAARVAARAVGTRTPDPADQLLGLDACAATPATAVAAVPGVDATRRQPGYGGWSCTLGYDPSFASAPYARVSYYRSVPLQGTPVRIGRHTGTVTPSPGSSTTSPVCTVSLVQRSFTGESGQPRTETVDTDVYGVGSTDPESLCSGAQSLATAVEANLPVPS